MDNFKVENKDEATVIFASTYGYLNQSFDTETSGNDYLSSSKVNNLQLIFRGKKEYVIECKDHIILDKIVRMCEVQDTYFPQAKPIITWLEQEGIKYFIASSTPNV